jgi:hypothetical protein
MRLVQRRVRLAHDGHEFGKVRPRVAEHFVVDPVRALLPQA